MAYFFLDPFSIRRPNLKKIFKKSHFWQIAPQKTEILDFPLKIGPKNLLFHLKRLNWLILGTPYAINQYIWSIQMGKNKFPLDLWWSGVLGARNWSKMRQKLPKSAENYPRRALAVLWWYKSLPIGWDSFIGLRQTKHNWFAFFYRVFRAFEDRSLSKIGIKHIGGN